MLYYYDYDYHDVHSSAPCSVYSFPNLWWMNYKK